MPRRNSIILPDLDVGRTGQSVRVVEGRFAGGGKVNRAALGAVRPACGEQVIEDRRPQRAAQMRSTLTPIQTSAAHGPSSHFEAAHVKANRREERTPRGRQRRAWQERDQAPRFQTFGRGYRPGAGEMIVAGPGGAQGLVLRSCPGSRRARSLGEAFETFQNFADIWSRQTIIAVTPLPLDHQQIRFKELGQMAAGRRRADPRGVTQFAGGERASVRQGREHAGPHWISQERGHGGDRRPIGHISIITEVCA